VNASSAQGGFSIYLPERTASSMSEGTFQDEADEGVQQIGSICRYLKLSASESGWREVATLEIVVPADAHGEPRQDARDRGAQEEFEMIEIPEGLTVRAERMVPSQCRREWPGDGKRAGTGRKTHRLVGGSG